MLCLPINANGSHWWGWRVSATISSASKIISNPISQLWLDYICFQALMHPSLIGDHACKWESAPPRMCMHDEWSSLMLKMTEVHSTNRESLGKSDESLPLHWIFPACSMRSLTGYLIQFCLLELISLACIKHGAKGIYTLPGSIFIWGHLYTLWHAFFPQQT